MDATQSLKHGSNRSALRQRKVKGEAPEKAPVSGTNLAKGKVSVISQLQTPWLQFRYCIGFLMGLVACVGSILTYEKDCTRKEYKFSAWLIFAVIGLYFHETRPFKRF
jgi:hypothetical protein